jgi:hypothetical protein
MRAIIAHEVGHVVFGDFTKHLRCRGSAVVCEHEVDLIAMRWVGKSAMIAALKEVIQFLEWEHGNQPIAYGGVGDMKKRLMLLEEMRDW